jgi:hypothetical protein
MSIIDISIYSLLLLIISCLGIYIVLTKPIAWEYFKAAISKDKYGLYIVDKNGVFNFKAAKFRNGKATLPNSLSKYLKMGLHGSYSLGSIRCDLVHSSVASIIEDNTLAIFQELEKNGIKDIGELTAACNRMALEKCKILNPATLTPLEREKVEYVANYAMNNISLLSPAIVELKVHDMLKNCVIDPTVISAATEETTAMIAAQYSKLMGAKKPGEGGFDPKMLMIIGIVVIGGALAAAFFFM